MVDSTSVATYNGFVPLDEVFGNAGYRAGARSQGTEAPALRARGSLGNSPLFSDVFGYASERFRDGRLYKRLGDGTWSQAGAVDL